MFCFEFLRILEKNPKKGKQENLGKHGPLRRNEGHPRHGVALRRNEAQGLKRPTLGFAA